MVTTCAFVLICTHIGSLSKRPGNGQKCKQVSGGREGFLKVLYLCKCWWRSPNTGRHRSCWHRNRWWQRLYPWDKSCKRWMPCTSSRFRCRLQRRGRGGTIWMSFMGCDSSADTREQTGHVCSEQVMQVVRPHGCMNVCECTQRNPWQSWDNRILYETLQTKGEEEGR